VWSEEDLSKSKQRLRAASPAIYLVAAVLAAIAGFGTVYVSFAPSDNGPAEAPGDSTAGNQAGGAGKGEEEVATGPLIGLNKGAMAALLVRPKPLDLPDLAFVDGTQRPTTLADWRGKVVLLNIWATWCVPCRDEMPALDKLETKLGGKDFEVVAVNIDKGAPEKPAFFLKEVGATHLGLYTDPTGKLFSTVKTVGMPTTLVIDRNGKEIGRLIGPADWASPEALALIAAAIAAPPTRS
jgi:thiol-disulfide isomerase/thioredoxin